MVYSVAISVSRLLARSEEFQITAPKVQLKKRFLALDTV